MQAIETLKKNWGWGVALTSVALLYFVCRHAYFVGFFNDDAFFIIGARSLLQGSYSELNSPAHPPLVNYMPGYPLLLCPLATLGDRAVPAYQLFSIALSVAGLIFLFIRFKSGVSSQVLIASLAVSAFNPLMVSLAATVLSDIPFLTVSAIILILPARIWERDQLGDWLPFIGLLAFAYYIRPVGLAWPIAVTLVLLFEKRWEPALFVAVFTVLLIAPFSIRTYWARGQILHYASELASPYGKWGSFAVYLRWFTTQAGFYLHEIFIRNFFRWPSFLQVKIVEFLTITGCLTLMVTGFWVSRKKSFGRVLPLYLLVYMCVHLAWSKQSGRYLFPIFPFVAFAFFQGAEIIGKKALRFRFLPACLAALAVILYTAPLIAIAKTSLFLRTPVNTPPLRTFEWVRARTEPDDLFAVELDGQFFLFTGRQTYHVPKIFDVNFLNLWLIQNKVRYIVLDNNPYIMKTIQGGTSHDPYPLGLLGGMVADQKRFERVFHDEAEGTNIYRVLPKI